MANGTWKVSNIGTSSGSGTITLGQSGETVTIPSGVTVSGAMANVPAFEAKLSADQSITDQTETKVAFDSEIYDTEGSYDTSTYRFTPQTSGRYFVYCNINCFQDDSSDLKVAAVKIYKNGSSVFETHDNTSGNYLRGLSESFSATLDLNGSTDYVEIFTFIEINSGANNIRIETSGAGSRNVFGAYKLIGI